MSKNKQSGKVLARNPSVASRPCRAVQKINSPKKVHFSEEVIETPPAFTAPEFCTLLQLADEMKLIRSLPNSTRSLPESLKCTNLNFSPEEKIYQDLVGLDVRDVQTANGMKIQSCPKLKKDPEIDLNKYTNYELQPEYFFTSYYVPAVQKQKTVFEGHSVYQSLQMWAESNN